MVLVVVVLPGGFRVRKRAVGGVGPCGDDPEDGVAAGYGGCSAAAALQSGLDAVWRYEPAL